VTGALLALLLACGLRRHEAVALNSIISNSAKSTGPLLIWLVKEVTFGRSPFLIG